MKNKNQTIDDLMNAFFDYMRSIHRCEGSFRRYRRNWKKIRDFMLRKRIKFYDAKVEQDFLKHEFGKYDYYQLDKKKKDLVNITEALTEFQATGRIFKGARKQARKKFSGSAADHITAFIENRRHAFKVSEKTIQSYIFHLHPLSCYVKDKKIKLHRIKSSEILDYVKQMSPDRPANKHVSLNILRCFLKYLYEQHVLPTDYSRIIPKDNYKNQPKLPSTFTDEEIADLLKSVDRGNPRGKRDYAILLLATKLGMRASDICELTFNNIIWERNVIELTQYKTKKGLELPLLPAVGNAIVDYLKYGRPVTDDHHCFIHVQGPYERLHTSDLGNLVRKYMTLGKINYSNRKHGPHSLRHSFASALLKEEVPLPIISEALGHSSMGSTMEYLRIDIGKLKKCALEVPLIPASFYEQKGGYRHE
jgi:site-specific recombinase XerD